MCINLFLNIQIIKILPKKGIKTFKRSKILSYFTYFQHFWKKFVFSNYICVFKKYKSVFFFNWVCEKFPSELLENYKYIPWMIFRALLMLGKLNFHSREPSFASVIPIKIMQPLKSKWRGNSTFIREWFCCHLRWQFSHNKTHKVKKIVI